jgi:hypothetical protein
MDGDVGGWDAGGPAVATGRRPGSAGWRCRGREGREKGGGGARLGGERPADADLGRAARVGVRVGGWGQPARTPALKCVNHCWRRSGSSARASRAAWVNVAAAGVRTPRRLMHMCWARTRTATPSWSQVVRQPVSDLHRQPLLHLHAARVQLDRPRQLRQSDDLPGRLISDVGVAHERHAVMGAQAVKGDALQHDQAVVAAAVKSGRHEHWGGASSSANATAIRRGVSARCAASRGHPARSGTSRRPPRQL